MRSVRLALGTLICVVASACVDGALVPDGGADLPLDAGTSADAGTDAGTDPFRDALLEAHNAVRANASPTPTPPLPPLSWSTSAEAAARSWADKCQWGHSSNVGQLGENIYGTTSSSTTPDAVVKAWASEAPFYDYASNTCASGEVCGHYTQIVWRNTTEVGCAKKDCTTGSPFGGGAWQFWVCNYAPPGNYQGQRPY